jgi:hypothetical protein
MSEMEHKKGREQPAPVSGSYESRSPERCEDIKDPVRKGLCRVCQMPVVGEAPFCGNHQPPVP